MFLVEHKSSAFVLHFATSYYSHNKYTKGTLYVSVVIVTFLSRFDIVVVYQFAEVASFDCTVASAHVLFAA